MQDLDFRKIYSNYLSKVDERLNSFLTEQTHIDKVSNKKRSIPQSLYNQTNYIMMGKGKRVRPLMLIFSCEAFGGTMEQALDAAVAVEILHNFTLVHDDIMDNADSRRGKETVHKKWSVNAAILVGDELIGLSYRSLLKTRSKRLDEIVKAFTDGVIEVCEGQALDKEFETDDKIKMSDYITMIRKKTAELIRVSAVIGSLIAEASDTEIEAISNFSHNIGIAFQIQDDLLDITADEKKLGKKTGSDIDEKKKTYLYLKALELLHGIKRDKFISLYNSDNKKGARKKSIMDLYFDICAVESARKDIQTYTVKANKYLSHVSNSGSREKLRYFSDMLLTRNY